MITNISSRMEQFVSNMERENSFLSKKIKTDFLSDKDINPNGFYCLNDNNLMLMGENISVSGSLSDEELEEVLSFCQFLGVYGLETSQTLQLGSKTVMNICQYKGEKQESCDQIIKNDNIYQFSQFSCDNFTGAAFKTVYSYFARKVNKGIADIYYTTDKGKIVSGALATHFDDDIYLTFVSTAKAYRRQGRAAQVLRHIISENPDRKIMLMCEKELIDFYAKLGFEKTGEIYLYTLREEHI